MVKVRIIFYTLFVLAYLTFLLYFLTLFPGGKNGDPNALKLFTAYASGGMMMMTIYAATLCLFQQGEKAALYFTLICASTGVRFLVMEGNMILTEILRDLPYNAAFSIYVVMTGLSAIGIICFICEIFATLSQKKRLHYLVVVLLIAYAAGGIVAALMGDGIMPVRAAISILTISVVGYGALIAYTSPALRTNTLYKLYFIAIIIFIAAAIFTAFFVDRAPNVGIITFSMFAVVHIILLSDRYSRTINEYEILEKLNRTKTEFLQDMSHEMKNPLTIIATGIDFADREIKKQSSSLLEAREALDRIREETHRLGRMIGGMVSLASISETAENRKRVDFAALLHNSAEAFRIPLLQKNNKLTVEIVPGLPDVFIEKDRFSQVLTNLFSNAAEYTKNGEIKLYAEASNSIISVRLTDTGRGVPPEIMPQVFERGVSDSGSTGYGLYISKVIVEAHGGTIKIESKIGKGTSVTFTVPAYSGQEAGYG